MLKHIQSAQILNFSILCPVTNKKFTVKYDSSLFHANSSDCDMCGSHGEITLTVPCKFCLKSFRGREYAVDHEISISDW